jgi:cation:H+ antiporter
LSLWPPLAIFFCCLALSIISSLVLSSGLEKIGAGLRFSPGLLGFVTALGADAPEIAAVVAALAAGHLDLGMGVVFGSNIFNLAALLGFSAVLAGRITVGRQGMLFDGVVAVLVTVVGVALVLGALSGFVALLLVGLLFVPYLLLTSLGSSAVQWTPFLPRAVNGYLDKALAQVVRDAREDRTPPRPTLIDVLAVVPAVVSIVLASIGMVHSAVELAGMWRLPHAVVGALVLAALTSIPNVIAAARLALNGRGSAVVSESLNSNSLNILAGVCLPAVVLGLGAPSALSIMAASWLLGMTVLAVALACFRGGLLRWEGASLIAFYVGFAIVILNWQQ